ncbi:MAG: disulfide oxidoreductase, partial [Rhodospirillaceae bacterium]|nr:disulfide oxidoreductase [Rhodospirillaceae bacterium]
LFEPDKTGLKAADRTIENAADSALVPELERRARLQIDAKDDAFSLDDSACVVWQGAVVATLTAGPRPLSPKVLLKADDRLDRALCDQLAVRHQAWVDAHIKKLLGPLIQAEAAPLKGAARGLAFQVSEALGTVDRKEAEAQVRVLTDEDRKTLAGYRIRFGLNFIYVPDVLKADPVRLRALLWTVSTAPDSVPTLPPAGRVSFPTEEGAPAAYYRASGFHTVKGMAYRVDMIERFSAEVRRLLREGIKILPPANLSPLGIGAENAVTLLVALGYVSSVTEEGIAIAIKRKPKRHKAPKAKPKSSNKAADIEKKKPRPRKPAEKPIDPDSPFAVLKDLVKS